MSLFRLVLLFGFRRYGLVVMIDLVTLPNLKVYVRIQIELRRLM